MNTEKFNHWLSVFSSIGIIIGLILVTIELSQNRDMMKSQTRNELARGVNELLASWYENPELLETIVKANRGEPLTDTEQLAETLRSEAAFRLWENVHYQYRQGLYEEVEFSGHLQTMHRVIEAQPSLVRYWCINRDMYSIPFAVEIDNIMAGSSCN